MHIFTRPKNFIVLDLELVVAMLLRLSYTYVVRGGGKFYIGSRQCKFNVLPHEDTRYVGTPTDKNFAAIPYEKKRKRIFRIFLTRYDAIAHEIILHKKYDVGKNPNFANKSRQTSTGFINDAPTSPELRKKQSETRKGEKNAFYGKKHSDESRRKLSEAHRGKKASATTRKKFSEMYSGSGNPMYGKTHTDKTKKKISQALTGLVKSPETCQKLSESHIGERNSMYGKTHTDETKEKISQALVGKLAGEKHPNFGKPRSPETKEKISKARMGKYTGPNHPRYDHNLYDWQHKNGKKILQITKYELAKRYNLNLSSLGQVLNGKIKNVKGWSLLHEQNPNKLLKTV